MLRKRWSMLSAILALQTSSLFAFLHPQVDQGQCWGVQGEYLYWLPDVDDTGFVEESSSPTTFAGKIQNNSFGFNSGFRVQAAYGLDCVTDFRLRYSRLKCCADKIVSGPNLVQVIGQLGQAFATPFSGSAESNLDQNYYNIEGVFSRNIFSGRCIDCYLFAGLQYYYFKLNEMYTYLSPTIATSSTVDRQNKNWGLGPQLGVEFSYPLNWFSWTRNNLSVSGLASGTLLANNGLIKYTSTLDGALITDTATSHIWRVIPAWNARIGLNYAADFFCGVLDVEIGYEFTTYQRALSRLNYVGGLGLSFTDYYNFEMQGLYAAIGITF